MPAYPRLYCEHDRMLEHHRRYRPNELRDLLARHLRIVASGSLFTTLLAPRAVTVALERAGRRQDATGVGAWNGGPALTAAVTGVLDADAAIGRRLARQRLVPGARLPGLSTWAVVSAMTSAAPSVVIVVPCYDEAGRLDPDGLTELSKRAGARLLLVDDGSTDATAAVLPSLGGVRSGAVRAWSCSRPTSARARPCGWGCAAPCRTAPPSSATTTPTWPRPRRRWPAWWRRCTTGPISMW